MTSKGKAHHRVVAEQRDLVGASDVVTVSWHHRYPGASGWVAMTTVGAAAISVTSVGPVARIMWVSPLALFWIVTIAAGLCTCAALWVLAVAHRDDRAEVGFLGSALLVVSMLPSFTG